jgi:uncharacterized phage protein (TIGR01671 family)
MNRPIKFRFWYKKIGRFVTSIVDETYRDCRLSIGPLGGLEAHDKYGDEVEIDEDDFVIQQFTGLFDREGKGIYEGDILEAKVSNEFATDNYETFLLGSVIWNKFAGQWALSESGEYDEMWSYIPLHQYSYLFSKSFLVGGKVIGNIFETPELLKNEQRN